MILKTNFNVLAVSYRGYSDSDPIAPNEAGLMKDADAIADFLINESSNHPEIKKLINRDLIFGHGRSLGGATAIYMAETYPNLFRGLIIESTFTSISDIASVLFPFLNKPLKRLLLRIDWNNKKRV